MYFNIARYVWIIHGNLCIFFSFSALVNTEDNSLGFLVQNPIDAMHAVELSHGEYLLVFNSEIFSIFFLTLPALSISR